MPSSTGTEQPSWKQHQAAFLLAYRAVRRARAGFHSVRPARMRVWRERYEEEYWSALREHESSYPHRVHEIERQNARLLAEQQEARRRLDAVARKHGTVQPRHLSEVGSSVLSLGLSPDPVPTLAEHLAEFPELDKFLDDRWRSNLEWGGRLAHLPLAEQYEALVVSRAILAPGKPRANMHRAYSLARAFHIAALRAPRQLVRLLGLRKVPESRSQALPTTQLAKLIVGETVRIPTGSADDDSRPAYRTRLWWDDRLVNKVATMLALMECEGVAVESVARWISDAGGIEACLRRYRQVEA